MALPDQPVASFVPAVWSGILLESLKQESGFLRALAAMLPDIRYDPMIMVCGHPWCLKWEEILDPGQFSLHYVADR